MSLEENNSWTPTPNEIKIQSGRKCKSWDNTPVFLLSAEIAVSQNVSRVTSKLQLNLSI